MCYTRYGDTYRKKFMIFTIKNKNQVKLNKCYVIMHIEKNAILKIYIKDKYMYNYWIVRKHLTMTDTIFLNSHTLTLIFGFKT